MLQTIAQVLRRKNHAWGWQACDSGRSTSVGHIGATTEKQKPRPYGRGL